MFSPYFVAAAEILSGVLFVAASVIGMFFIFRTGYGTGIFGKEISGIHIIFFAGIMVGTALFGGSITVWLASVLNICLPYHEVRLLRGVGNEAAWETFKKAHFMCSFLCSVFPLALGIVLRPKNPLN